MSYNMPGTLQPANDQFTGYPITSYTSLPAPYAAFTPYRYMARTGEDTMTKDETVKTMMKEMKPDMEQVQFANKTDTLYEVRKVEGAPKEGILYEIPTGKKTREVKHGEYIIAGPTHKARYEYVDNITPVIMSAEDVEGIPQNARRAGHKPEDHLVQLEVDGKRYIVDRDGGDTVAIMDENMIQYTEGGNVMSEIAHEIIGDPQPVEYKANKKVTDYPVETEDALRTLGKKHSGGSISQSVYVMPAPMPIKQAPQVVYYTQPRPTPVYPPAKKGGHYHIYSVDDRELIEEPTRTGGNDSTEMEMPEESDGEFVEGVGIRTLGKKKSYSSYSAPVASYMPVAYAQPVYAAPMPMAPPRKVPNPAPLKQAPSRTYYVVPGAPSKYGNRRLETETEEVAPEQTGEMYRELSGDNIKRPVQINDSHVRADGRKETMSTLKTAKSVVEDTESFETSEDSTMEVEDIDRILGKQKNESGGGQQLVYVIATPQPAVQTPQIVYVATPSAETFASPLQNGYRNAYPYYATGIEEDTVETQRIAKPDSTEQKQGRIMKNDSKFVPEGESATQYLHMETDQQKNRVPVEGTVF